MFGSQDASEPYGRPAVESPNNNRLSRFASAIAGFLIFTAAFSYFCHNHIKNLEKVKGVF